MSEANMPAKDDVPAVGVIIIGGVSIPIESFEATGCDTDLATGLDVPRERIRVDRDGTVRTPIAEDRN